MNLIHTEILCSIRRLLPGDLKIAFVGPGQGQTFDIDDNVFGEKIELNDTKGGVNLNEYLTFNSLVNTGEELQQRCVDHHRVVLFSKNTSLLPYFFTHATIDPTQPVKLDLNKKTFPKQKTIQNFTIDAQGFRKTKNENPPTWEMGVTS